MKGGRLPRLVCGMNPFLSSPPRAEEEARKSSDLVFVGDWIRVNEAGMWAWELTHN